MNLAAHELLETSEALRTKAAEIEQHGVFAAQCNDQTLQSILKKHQQQMISAYQQGINLVTGKGAQVTHQHPSFQSQHSIGIEGQTTMSAPATNPSTLSDQTIATLALNVHKTGSMMGMQWANECADAQIRMYHVNGANLCQEMAYEIWAWMNQNGYYQPPTFTQQQTSQMTAMFQPMNTMMMGNTTMQQHNSGYTM
ncbi:spore coat protein [Alkalihalobacillus sp. LMS39]|uniref:spore coat protein n=1 Tax=Alkalihalobacillus sp. LMS39 TaxID=2924032 RepID=UPI001FB274BF|nr:spore coat protein [Alkalihalobacillus sp. LMS39]UOE96276.1 spore coat protein [Alkalihalobacillus sp. LMS39]